MNQEYKTLLVVIGGGINKRYMDYKWLIRERYQARQVKPYVLEFPRELTEVELKNIKGILNKASAKYEIFSSAKIR